MKTLISTIAIVAATATAGVAGTYRIDVMPAEGVVFAPFGNGSVTLAEGQTVSGAQKTQAIDGKPISAVAGHHNAWFIVEAEEGDVINFTAMQGNSIDTLGQAVIKIPADRSTEEMVSVVDVENAAGFDRDGNPMFTKDEIEFITPATFVHAQRISGAVINGFDAGADEGTDTLTSVADLGYVKVTRLSADDK